MTYTFKIKIDGSSKPPIWRKLKIDSSATFMEFHFAIQGVFDWHHAHLFRFSPEGRRSTPYIEMKLEEDWMDEPFSEAGSWPVGERYDADTIHLHDFFHTLKQKMIYNYDFGDDWHHTIELVAMDPEENLLVPKCVAGKGRAPVEDCGGIWGYYHMVDAINDPKHPENAHWREWLQLKKRQKWDVARFELKETQLRLAEMWRMKEEW